MPCIQVGRIAWSFFLLMAFLTVEDCLVVNWVDWGLGMDWELKSCVEWNLPNPVNWVPHSCGNWELGPWVDWDLNFYVCVPW